MKAVCYRWLNDRRVGFLCDLQGQSYMVKANDIQMPPEFRYILPGWVCEFTPGTNSKGMTALDARPVLIVGANDRYFNRAAEAFDELEGVENAG